MQLLVNYQNILLAIQSKNIFLEQICYKRSEGIIITSLHCLVFSTTKNKYLKGTSKSATNVVQHWNFSRSQSLFIPSNLLKLTIYVHSVRPIRSLKFLHHDDLWMIWRISAPNLTTISISRTLSFEYFAWHLSKKTFIDFCLQRMFTKFTKFSLSHLKQRFSKITVTLTYAALALITINPNK